MKKLPAQPVQGLIDGLEVLQELAASHAPASCKAISEKLGIELTKVNRILKTLDYLGIAYRDKSRKYTPGPGIHALAIQSMIGSGLLPKALPVLEELRKHGLTVALGVLWKNTVSYLFHYSPGMSASESLGRLSLHPASNSSIGIALLSEKDAYDLENIYPEGMPDGLASSLSDCRVNGYAAMLNNRSTWSIAVKIGSPAYAGIALSGIEKEDEIPRYVEILNEAVIKIQG